MLHFISNRDCLLLNIKLTALHALLIGESHIMFLFVTVTALLHSNIPVPHKN